MHLVKLTKKKFVIFIVILVLAILLFTYSISFGMQHYYKLDFSTGLVTATTLNVRSGPGTRLPSSCYRETK